MEIYNIIAAWIGIGLGIVSGIPMGLFFHKEDWLGGYQSWTRRLVRLGHISFFGIAFLNLAFAFTVIFLHLQGVSGLIWPSVLFMVAQVSMPAICFGAAFWKPVRHFFFVPVASALGAAVGTMIILVGVIPR